MKIIGINSNFDHKLNKINSGSCALIIDGEIVFALAEDRVSRKKDEGGFSQSLKFILKKTGLKLKDVDYFYISFYGNAILPKKEMIRRHADILGLKNHFNKIVLMPSHHFSHAVLAHSLSPFEESIIVVADNEGNFLYPSGESKDKIEETHYERNSYFWARGNCISLIERDFDNPGDVGFGKAYSMFNRYIGLGNYLSVGKTMGLSSYGKRDESLKNVNLWNIDNLGKLKSNIFETNSSVKDINNFLSKYNIPIPSRIKEPLYELNDYKNLAYYIQDELNNITVEKIKFLIKKVGIKNICISGGVALNGIMNHKIETTLSVPVFVPPYPSDPGQALGNAIFGFLSQAGLNNNTLIKKVLFKNFTYLGSEYTNQDILNSLKKYSKKIKFYFETDIEQKTAELLHQNKIGGWFQGRSEYGARALGNRSIIARPDSVFIRDKVNLLKNRELFRPIAPSVLSEYWKEYFKKESLLDRYMLGVKLVKKSKIKNMPGVVHVDGTARPQIVFKKDNPRYYNLIFNYKKLSSLPMIINTSFNKAGEPIVETPENAVESFLEMGLDFLVCGNYLIHRST